MPGEYSALPHFHSLGSARPKSAGHRGVRRGRRARRPARSPGEGVRVPSQPFPHPRTFSFSSKLRGFPGGSSIGPANEREEQPSPAPGLRTRGLLWARAPPAPREGMGRPGHPQRATSELPRALNPANGVPRWVAHAQPGLLSAGRGRLAGAELGMRPEAAWERKCSARRKFRHPRRTERLTGFDWSPSCLED